MKIKCPTCGKATVYDATNRFRPFCSERCQTLDLGAWADERYVVPGSERPNVNENANAESPAGEPLPPKHLLN